MLNTEIQPSWPKTPLLSSNWKPHYVTLWWFCGAGHKQVALHFFLFIAFFVAFSYPESLPKQLPTSGVQKLYSLIQKVVFYWQKLYSKKKLESMPLTVPIYTERNLFMDHWLNKHDFVMTGVSDKPMNIPKLVMSDVCRILYRTE